MKYLFLFFIVAVLPASAWAETIQVSSRITDSLLEMSAGEKDYIDVFVYNLGDVDVSITVRLDNLPEMMTRTEPNNTILKAEKTKTPYSDSDTEWYLMADGETYAPGKKLRFYVEAPLESDTLYAGIFSSVVSIEARALDAGGNTVRTAIGYEQAYNVAIRLLTDPLPYAKDIHLTQGEQTNEQLEKKKDQPKETTQTYTLLDTTHLEGGSVQEKDSWSISTIAIVLLGLLVLVYLLKR